MSPIYAYRCENGHKEEKLIHFSDYSSDSVCDQCGEKSERIFANQGVKGVVRGGTGGGRKMKSLSGESLKKERRNN